MEAPIIFLSTVDFYFIEKSHYKSPLTTHFNDIENDSGNSLGNLDSMSVLLANVANLIAFLWHISTTGSQALRTEEYDNHAFHFCFRDTWF